MDKNSARSSARGSLLGDDAGGAHALGSLCNEEHASLLDGFVNVVSFVGAVGNVIVCNVVDFMLFQEFDVDDPRAVFDDLVNPFAVSDRLGSLLAAEDCQSLSPVCFLVASDADYKVGVGEGRLGLLELAHVAGSKMSAQEGVSGGGTGSSHTQDGTDQTHRRRRL